MGDINVIIADVHEARCAQYERLVGNEADISIVAYVKSSRELLERVVSAKPDALVISVDFCPDDLSAVIHLVREDSPRTHILLISNQSDENLLLDALSAGARGYLEEGELDQYLTKSLKKILDGEAWIPRKMVTPLLERLVWVSRTSLTLGPRTPRTKVQ